MKKITVLFFLLTMVLTAGFSCLFEIESEKSVYSAGEQAYIRMVVYKDHNNCTLSSMDEYYIEGTNLTVQAKTDWKLIARNTYEIWVQVQFGSKGEAEIKIWKNCSKQGYEEEVLDFLVK